MQACEVTHVENWDLSKVAPPGNKSKYWILLNEKQGNFTLQEIPGFKVLSIISFEPLFYDNQTVRLYEFSITHVGQRN